MLKLASIIIGEDPAYTAGFQPASKRKVILLASSLLLPVLLWFTNGYLLVSQVIRGGTVAALLTAIIAALVIFLIERAVIMSKASRVITAFRFLLGFVIALLGSIGLDEVIFKQDIDNKVAAYSAANVRRALAEVDSSYSMLIDAQQFVATQKYLAWRESLARASGEADGTDGSGIARVGKIAQLKLRVASLHEGVYNSEKQKLDVLHQEWAAQKAAEGKKAWRSFNSNGLLLRIKALHELIRDDLSMLVLYLLFTTLLFLLEFIVVLVKTFSSESIDEQLEGARERLMLLRVHKTMENATLYFEPGLHDSRVIDARAALSKVKPGKSLTH